MNINLNITDKELTDYYIKGPKILSIIFFTISCIFLISSIFLIYILWFFAISIYMTLIFLVVYILHQKKYGNKVLLKADSLDVYDFRNKFLCSFYFSEITFIQQIVKFPGPRYSFTNIECIVLYTNNAKFENDMEYPRDSDIIVFQNPEIIKELISSPSVRLNLIAGK